MTHFRSQFRQKLPDGALVERLPLGWAAGRWWATFVCAWPGHEVSESLGVELAQRMPAWVDDPDGRLDCVGGGGGGSEREYAYTWELVDHGARQARVSYVDDGVEIAHELLTLEPGDRAGCFATRLPDGSLIERLPVGRSLERWRLHWVRSEVPLAEIEASARDDEAFDMPHERFVRVRSGGDDLPLHRASGTLGGPVQPFAVDLPDSLTHLEIDYVVDNAVVSTEQVLLPPSS